LTGFAARPLSRYLATLGTFKVLANQLDPGIRLGWQGDRPFLADAPEVHEILRFLLVDYAPTPLVAPWNGSTDGGFKPGSDDAFAKLIRTVQGSDLERLAPMREVFTATAHIVGHPGWDSARDKTAQVRMLRNSLPDSAIEFLDASVALTADGIKFPPLLGTGGNIGRLDLVRNYWAYLLDVMNITPAKRGATSSEDLLRGALFGEPVRLVVGSPGQFDSKGAGGANESRNGSAAGLINPWMYILSMEGALLFAATSSRRLGSHRTAAAAPFTVSGTQVGYASSAPAENANYEFWAPLWSRPSNLDAIRGVLAEGRANWGASPARNGVDFLRAMRSLGVDRGLNAFVRYVFLERNGQSKVAVPLGIHRVVDDRGVQLTSDLDPWIQRLRGAGPNSAAVRSAANRVESALFAAAERPESGALSALLYECAQAELALGRSRSARDSGIPPIPMLSAKHWLPRLAEPSPEFRVALAIASGFQERPPRIGASDSAGRLERASQCRTWAEYLRPITRARSRFVWSERGALVPGFGTRPILDLLADCLVLRAASEPGLRSEGSDDESLRLGQSPHDRYLQFHSLFAAPAADVEALAMGWIDPVALQRWIQVLFLLTDYRYVPRQIKETVRGQLSSYSGDRAPAAAPQVASSVSPVWRLLAPWFGGVPPAKEQPDLQRHAPTPSSSTDDPQQSVEIGRELTALVVGHRSSAPGLGRGGCKGSAVWLPSQRSGRRRVRG
jgi:CRISPR-associated protein Csx17